jgi:tetratricopeptide (TPR) repeat protein
VMTPEPAAAESLEELIDRGYELHQAKNLREAEVVYRDALEAHGPDALLLYNLGVLLEDLDRRAEAVEAYEAAIAADASLADCYYNLALACEALGRAREAIRYMAKYRRLTAGKA